MNLDNGEGQMECIYGQLFPAVARGVMLGSVAGAVLGGAVAFATRNPYRVGLMIGGITGGIAGGVIAYYNFTMDRANNDSKRALSDINQDIRSDSIKLSRMADASSQAFNELKVSIGNNSKLSPQFVDKQQQLRLMTVENYQDVIKICKETVELHKDKVRDNSKIEEELRNINNRLNINLEYIKDINRNLEETKHLIMLKS
ncbi:MAG: glycine zipper domain-containing protein [Desulfocapsaceae bacterium]|nr:glycine zipper domain-containing protein [Desulfocapsaceae bacterium]